LITLLQSREQLKMHFPKIYNTYFVALVATVGGTRRRSGMHSGKGQADTQ